MGGRGGACEDPEAQKIQELTEVKEVRNSRKPRKDRRYAALLPIPTSGVSSPS